MNADTALQKIRMYFPHPDYSAAVNCDVNSYAHANPPQLKTEFTASAWIAGALGEKTCQEWHNARDSSMAKAVAKLIKGRTAKASLKAPSANVFFAEAERMAA